jgi:hypothetical protein
VVELPEVYFVHIEQSKRVAELALAFLAELRA